MNVYLYNMNVKIYIIDLTQTHFLVLLNINSFNGAIIVIYVTGRGFRVRRNVLRQVNNNN